MPQIFFNGKQYNSFDEMPADLRAAYAQVMEILKDENNNDVPDLFEGDIVQKIMGMANTHVVVNGQEMQGFDSLSPEARAKFEKVMSRLGLTGLNLTGSPSQLPMQSAPQNAWGEPAFKQSPPLIQSSPSAISEETSSRRVILILVLAALLLCALAAAGILLYKL